MKNVRADPLIALLSKIIAWKEPSMTPNKLWYKGVFCSFLTNAALCAVLAFRYYDGSPIFTGYPVGSMLPVRAAAFKVAKWVLQGTPKQS